LKEIQKAIGDSLSNLVSSDDEEDGDVVVHNREDSGLGKESEDEEPGWVMDTIFKTEQQCMESFRQKQMRLEELTQPGWGDAADYFHG